VTRKLKRFEIQQAEVDRIEAKDGGNGTARAAPRPDDTRFLGRVGAVIAELVRESKPNAGPLHPSMNIELDLGFDSLARVELLGLAEGRWNPHR
jgi:hypothetical protein